MFEFGSVVKIPATNRLGVISGTLNINKKLTVLIYPISSLIYLASNKDFLCKRCNDTSYIMIETWNPVLIVFKQELEIVDTISKEYLEIYEKFLYSILLDVDFEEKKSFTGPPLSSNTDVRYLFKHEERKPFEFLLRPFKRLVTSITPVSM